MLTYQSINFSLSLSLSLSPYIYIQTYICTYILYSLSKFLRWSLLIFIIKGYCSIVFIFIVIFTFRLICPPAFFSCLSNLGTFMKHWTTSFIESIAIRTGNPRGSNYILMFRFSIFACCRSLFIYDSHLSYQPGFDFLSVVFKWMPIFSKINFVPAFIKLLTPWCLSGFLSIGRSLSWFRTWLSSSFGSWEKAMWFSFQTWFF